MSRQTLAVLAGAVVALALGVFGALAFTGGGSSPGGAVHTMPDGATMTGPMSTTGVGVHTMEDGSTMDGMDMSP